MDSARPRSRRDHLKNYEQPRVAPSSSYPVALLEPLSLTQRDVTELKHPVKYFRIRAALLPLAVFRRLRTYRPDGIAMPVSAGRCHGEFGQLLMPCPDFPK